jgi:membrane-bound lytic murein transglycosylase B
MIRRSVPWLAVAALLAGCGGTGPTAGQTTTTSTTTSTATSTATTPSAPASTPSVPAHPRTPATSPAELAERIIGTEAAIRDPATTGAALTEAAFANQLLYRQLARTPGWQQSVLQAVGAELRATVEEHLTARRSMRSILTKLSDEVPAWRIAEPAPVEELMRHYREGERTFGIPWEVLAAINLVETGFGKIRGFSTAGAQGPMQFMPATWEAYGRGDINDPRDAILAAARYLAASGGTSEAGLDRAIHAYNHHDGYVAGVRAYASVLQADPRALRGLHQWQIIYLSASGDLWLPIGYRSRTPVPVATYVTRYPERHLGTETR